MSEHTELVARLRADADLKWNLMRDYEADLLREAADVLARLSAELDRYKDAMEVAYDELFGEDQERVQAILYPVEASDE